MDIRISENFWASSMLPQGIVERWYAPEGAHIETGDLIAAVRIEDALHEITAPSAGRLTILTGTGGLIEPGSILGRLGEPV